jgi:DNA-binding NarL/FixJ family response regulator
VGRLGANPRLACVGVVRHKADARAALLAALKGAAIVVVIPEAAEGTATFVDDLARIRPVEIRTERPSGQPGVQERDLLRLLADGRTVREAARALHLSLRSAHRRLSRARAALGARTTAEAVHIARSRGLC